MRKFTEAERRPRNEYTMGDAIDLSTDMEDFVEEAAEDVASETQILRDGTKTVIK